MAKGSTRDILLIQWHEKEKLMDAAQLEHCLSSRNMDFGAETPNDVGSVLYRTTGGEDVTFNKEYNLTPYSQRLQAREIQYELEYISRDITNDGIPEERNLPQKIQTPSISVTISLAPNSGTSPCLLESSQPMMCLRFFFGVEIAARNSRSAINILQTMKQYGASPFLQSKYLANQPIRNSVWPRPVTHSLIEIPQDNAVRQRLLHAFVRDDEFHGRFVVGHAERL